MSLILLPAVDVVDGKAVRLVQGKAGSETDYGSALEAAQTVATDSGLPAEVVYLYNGLIEEEGPPERLVPFTRAAVPSVDLKLGRILVVVPAEIIAEPSEGAA